MGHEWPVQKPTFIRTEKARTHLLFYSILFCSILFHFTLFYSILLYSIPFYSILFYSVIFYSILLYSIPFYSILFHFTHSILFYSIFLYSIPFYSTLFYSIHRISFFRDKDGSERGIVVTYVYICIIQIRQTFEGYEVITGVLTFKTSIKYWNIRHNIITKSMLKTHPPSKVLNHY